MTADNTTEILAAGKRRTWRDTGTTTSGDLLEDALEVAATVAEPWVIIAAGDQLDAIEAAATPAGLWRQAWRMVRTLTPRAITVIRTIEVARAAKTAGEAGARGAEVAFVVRDRTLESLLLDLDSGPVIVGRRVHGDLSALRARPGLAMPVWSADEVRTREAKLLRQEPPAGDDPVRVLERAGTEALLSIAKDRYAWAILPTDLMGQPATEFRLRGFRFHRPLKHDPRFRVMRLPVGWTLSRMGGEDRWLEIRDECGAVRVELFYKTTPGDRQAHMRLLNVVNP